MARERWWANEEPIKIHLKRAQGGHGPPLIHVRTRPERWRPRLRSGKILPWSTRVRFIWWRSLQVNQTPSRIVHHTATLDLPTQAGRACLGRGADDGLSHRSISILAVAEHWPAPRSSPIGWCDFIWAIAIGFGYITIQLTRSLNSS